MGLMVGRGLMLLLGVFSTQNTHSQIHTMRWQLCLAGHQWWRPWFSMLSTWTCTHFLACRWSRWLSPDIGSELLTSTLGCGVFVQTTGMMWCFFSHHYDIPLDTSPINGWWLFCPYFGTTHGTYGGSEMVLFIIETKSCEMGGFGLRFNRNIWLDRVRCPSQSTIGFKNPWRNFYNDNLITSLPGCKLFWFFARVTCLPNLVHPVLWHPVVWSQSYELPPLMKLDELSNLKAQRGNSS